MLVTKSVSTDSIEQNLYVSGLLKENAYYKEENERLEELVRLLRRQHFAPRSEKIPADQLHLFNEAEEQAKASSEEEGTEVKPHKRGKPKRKPLPDNLPREVVVKELPREQRECCCEGCDCEMEVIGEEVSEQVDILPARIRVIRWIRKKYACKKHPEGGVKIAPVPPKPIPKAIATAGLLAFIIASKYADGLPLYRIENIFSRYGIDIFRSTMGRWMVKVYELIIPLLNLLQDELLSSDYLNMDETTVQVLDEPGKKPTTLSYMWVRARAGPDPPIVLFDYDPTRSGDVPVNLLEGFEGYLQVDGYGGYNKVCDQNPKIIRLGCWDHVRRKFHSAFKATKGKKAKAGKALSLIKKLYKIEEGCKEMTAGERLKVRQKESKPIVEELKGWIKDYRGVTPPKSLLGKAINYAYNEWSHLTPYLEDGRLNISNCFVENAIRPFAVGRKAWLFSATVDGAKASAGLYSLVETAKANGLEPYWYFRFILEKLPLAETVEDFEALLPWNAKLPLTTP